MSMSTLERAVLAESKTVFKNLQLKKKDILAWSSGEVQAENDIEVVARLPGLGVNVVILKVKDKRK